MSCPVNVHPHHVGIFVSSIDRSVSWWEEMLGFEKKFENVFFLPDYGDARIAWLEKDRFYIELFDFPGLRTDNSNYWKTYGTKHVCLYVADEDFDTLRSYLKEKGVQIVVEAEHSMEKLKKPGSTKVVFVLDPDGTSAEIQQTYHPGDYL
jgi:catechol 2,3-dioxygenase-like lactoylglutathione lyase family enzyme